MVLTVIGNKYAHQRHPVAIILLHSYIQIAEYINGELSILPHSYVQGISVNEQLCHYFFNRFLRVVIDCYSDGTNATLSYELTK